MKLTLAFPAIALGFLTSLQLPATGDDSPDGYERFRERGAQLTSDYSLKSPFNPEELRSLADQPSRSRGEQRRMMLLILHAGIEKDKGFQDLLENPELRKTMNVDLALCGYDYMVNKSEPAFDHILAQLATEDIGADVDTMVVLSTLDEWDRSIRAFRKHFVHTDGAGGLCKVGFKTTRAYLYPKKYEEMRHAIEAPIDWTMPLLPREQ